MPRYLFNIYENEDIREKTGIDLPNTKAALKQAVRYAGNTLADEDLDDSLDLDWRMEVTDEKGLLLFRLDFLLTISPATSEFHALSSKAIN